MPELVDLSHVVEAGMVTYPGLPGPVITSHLSREESREHYVEGTEFDIGRIEMVGNTGTYLDVPFHRFADGYDLASLSLGRVADLPGVCIETTQQEIDAEIITGTDVTGGAVLFRTGWDRHWRTETYGNPGHPYLTEAATAALVEAGALLVGIDSVNVDDTRGGARPAHTGLLAAGIPIVEHLTGLELLVGRRFRFYAVPVAVKGLGTFPVRAFAILP